jgi:ABC-2 type transport system permease protein
MIRDVATVCWKEWLEYVQQENARRSAPLRNLALVAAGGIFLGWQLDPDFGRSWLTVVLTAFLSIMFVTTVIPDAFAGERERHTLETLLASRLSDRAILLGKVAAAASYGWAIALAVLPMGIVAANLIHGADGMPWIFPWVVLTALGLSLLSGLTIAAVGVHLSLYAPTARQAHQRLGFVILGIFMTPAAVAPALPSEWRAAILEWLDAADLALVVAGVFAFLAAASVVLLVAALLRLHRARLIL